MLVSLLWSVCIEFARLGVLLLAGNVAVLLDLDRSLGRMVQGKHVVVVHL